MLKTSSPRLAFLEGLRGIAALIVLIHHLLLAFWPTVYFGTHETAHHQLDIWTYNYSALTGFLHSGTFSVALFFVLSGYVLTFRYSSEGNTKLIQSLAIKRYFRLAIPALGSILIAYFLMKLGLMYNQEAVSITQSVWLGWYYHFSPNFFNALYEGFVGVLLEGHSSYNSSLWTLPIEFFASFFVMSVAVMFNDTLVFLRYCFISLISCFIIYRFGETGIWYGLFLMGYALGISTQKTTITKRLAAPLILVIIYCAGANNSAPYQWLNMLNFNLNTHPMSKNIILYSLGSVLLVYLLLRNVFLQKLFSSRFCCYLGKLSFSLYVIHVPIICSLGCYSLLKLSQYMRYNYAALISFILSFGAVFVISHLYQKTIDNKAIDFSAVFYRFCLKNPKPNIKMLPVHDNSLNKWRIPSLKLKQL